MIIAHWTYSKQEWKAYLYNRLKRKNILVRTWKKLLLSFISKTPEVKITPDSITIGKDQKEISHALWVSNIELLNIDEINMMTVSFEGIGAGNKAGKIHIPVPKGKLREAIVVQEKLTCQPCFSSHQHPAQTIAQKERRRRMSLLKEQ